MKTTFAAIFLAAMALTGVSHADSSPDDIDSRVYDGAGFDSTRFSVVLDKVTGVTCYIAESQSDGSSPAMKCFTKQELRKNDY